MGNLSADSVKLTASWNRQTVSHHLSFDADATVLVASDPHVDFGAIRGFRGSAPGALSTV